MMIVGWDFRAGEIWEDLTDRFESRSAYPQLTNSTVPRKKIKGA